MLRIVLTKHDHVLTEMFKYFNMLDEGVVMKKVKQVMRADGYDPYILDDYQYARTRH